MGCTCNYTDGTWSFWVWYIFIGYTRRIWNLFPFVRSCSNLLFSGASVLPTSHNNRSYIEKQLLNAVDEMEQYIKTYPDFPVPACYAHPVVLKRMQDILKEGRAETIPAALRVLKEDLKALNSSVVVEQEEYDEIVAIKPMFLVMDYR